MNPHRPQLTFEEIFCEDGKLPFPFGSNKETILRVVARQLSKAYGYLWALKEINVEFRDGDCVALLGPNGAGKTTLLKLLSALLSPTTGEIQIDGEKLRQGNFPLRSAIGLLSPDGQIYDKLTATENLRFFTALSGKKMKSHEVAHALDRVGLSSWSDAYGSSLSHGMKCRLAIAKWSLLEPKLLLLDEPYGVLDGAGVDLLEAFLKGMCRNGGIVVMATHNVQRILTFCSRALILQGGKVIFDEPRQEPWKSFQDVFARFLPSEE